MFCRGSRLGPCAVAAILAGAVMADVPDAISYQGVLLDPGGLPTNAPANLRFRIFRGGDDTSFPSTGALSYHEITTVSPVEGVFSHLIGTGVAASDCASGPCVLDATVFGSGDVPVWIEVTLDPDGLAGSSDDDVLLPRTRVGTVGYAYRVASLDGATGGNVTGTIVADQLIGRTGAVLGEPTVSTVDLRFEAAAGSTTVTWDPAASELAFAGPSGGDSGMTYNPTTAALSVDGTISGGNVTSGTNPGHTHPEQTLTGEVEGTLGAAVIDRSIAPTWTGVHTFANETTLTSSKGFVQQAAPTFPGGQSGGSPGIGVKMRQYVYESYDAGSDALGSVPGDDTEFIWVGPYYNASTTDILARENPADYSLGFQFTAGWTHLSGDRRAEWFLRHVLKDGSATWYPFAWNIVSVDSNSPLLDYTIYSSPTQIALQVNPFAVAIGAAAIGRGELEVASGSGTLFLGGSTGGRVKFEGTVIDANHTEVTARNPTVDRSLEFPNASGMVHLNPYNEHVGTVMFGDSDDTADTGNEVCQSVNLLCVAVRTIDGTQSDCTTDQGTATTLFYAFCRR